MEPQSTGVGILVEEDQSPGFFVERPRGTEKHLWLVLLSVVKGSMDCPLSTRGLGLDNDVLAGFDDEVLFADHPGDINLCGIHEEELAATKSGNMVFDGDEVEAVGVLAAFTH